MVLNPPKTVNRANTTCGCVALDSPQLIIDIEEKLDNGNTSEHFSPVKQVSGRFGNEIAGRKMRKMVLETRVLLVHRDKFFVTHL